jgi:hypothetical protein
MVRARATCSGVDTGAAYASGWAAGGWSNTPTVNIARRIRSTMSFSVLTGTCPSSTAVSSAGPK